MDARTYLEQVGKLDRLIANKLIEMEQWRQIAQGISVSNDGERVKSSGSQQKMADAVVKIVEVEETINALVDHFVEVKLDVIDTIEKLDAKAYDLTHKRYIQGFDLLAISESTGESMSTLKHRHGKALKKVQAMLDERGN